MTELLPCPFCGGEAFINCGHEFRWCECRDCGAEARTCNTEAEAIEAWNTRADYHGYEQAAIDAWKNIKAYKERTCKRESRLMDTGRWYMCSECRHQLKVNGNYCPNCGAKVVGE